MTQIVISALYARMIDSDTGEIDALAITEAAKVRAAREYGAPNFPPIYLRQATEWCQGRAHSLRLDWRRQRGLPDDSAVEMRDVPAWGSSGDSFAR
jgi:hypothetical protein